MKRLIAPIVGVLMAGGLALTPLVVAYAGDDDHKEDICHPNNGNGYVHIGVDKHSSHFNDDGSPKHTNKDGQSDTYSVNGLCPGEQPTETVTETPSEEPSETPSETPSVDPTVTETVDPGCPRVPASNEPCEPNETTTATETPVDPNRPIRSSQCVGHDLVVTIEFPNGDIEHTPHLNWRACFTPGDPRHGIGTPRRADATSVTVKEEGM